ncbi:hypothetical protein DBR43_14720 [Pedobacter sp. KBW06]|uniref:class I SAM-dependent methyltransferase n=1 Tax=Pedobacter sp. KBW06 TaxID=2153359 RepID=UPI000F5AC566|nr:class I SAM-dependent methyltransferase [Pedobacter sp. KBW06]RQO72444.1 hypothetical protein DBR43_14720 [Pedobacter sp. KBW06]
MKSKITGGQTELAFVTKVLKKYDVKYYRCLDTGFVQTEEPYWLEEAYSSAITKLDIGMLSRNEVVRDKTLKILPRHFDANKRFLDYAGGYGIFTRLMRDKGYDYYHSDIYCQNIFAEYFDLANCPQQDNFELVTAFEVLEHLVNPMEEIRTMLALSDNLLFTTELQPEEMQNNLSDWWYIVPETGQHIALYTEKSLHFIAKELGLHCYSDGVNTHLFTKKKLSENPFEEQRPPYLLKVMKRKVARYDRKQIMPRESLLAKDFHDVKAKLNS